MSTLFSPAAMLTICSLIFLLTLLESQITNAASFARPRPVRVSPPAQGVSKKGGVRYGAEGVLTEKEIMRQRAEEELFETIIERVLDVLADFYKQEDVQGNDPMAKLKELKQIGVERELVIEALYSLTTNPRVRVYSTSPVEAPSIIPSSGIYIGYFLPPAGKSGASVAIRSSASADEGSRDSCIIQMSVQNGRASGERDEVQRFLVKPNTCQDVRYIDGCRNSCTDRACSGTPYRCQDQSRLYYDIIQGFQCERLPVNSLCSPHDFESLDEEIAEILGSDGRQVFTRESDYEDAPEVLLKDEIDLSGVENKINIAMAEESSDGSQGDMTVIIIVGVVIAFVLLALGSRAKKNNHSSSTGPSPMTSNTGTTSLNMT